MQHAAAQDTEWLIRWLLSFSMHSTTLELHTRRRKTHTRWQKQTRLLHTTAGSFLYSSNDTARAIWRYFLCCQSPAQSEKKLYMSQKHLKQVIYNLYTTRKHSKSAHVQYVYEQKTLRARRIHIVYEPKILQNKTYTICTRAENASGKPYTVCIRVENEKSARIQFLFETKTTRILVFEKKAFEGKISSKAFLYIQSL